MPVSPPATREVVPDHPGRAGGRDPFKYIGWWDLFDRVAKSTVGTLPQWVHGIQVAVVGGPKSHIKRLWYLALSAAFGRFRDRVLTAVHTLNIKAQWDITNKSVSVELVYEDTGWGVASTYAPFAAQAPLNAPSSTGLARLVRGPEQLTVGGSWPNDLVGANLFTVAQVATPTWTAAAPCPLAQRNLTASVLPYTTIGGRRNIGTGQAFTGTPATAVTVDVTQEYPWNNGIDSAGFFLASNYGWFGIGSLAGGRQPWPILAPDGINNACRVILLGQGAALPTLPDDGRVITTVEQNDPDCQPPRPIIDGQTRSGLLSLVAQTLSYPCYLPTTPPCTLTPAASAGTYVYPPGASTKLTIAQTQLLISNMDEEGGTLPANIGPDGYPTEPTGPVAPSTATMPNFGDT